MSNKNILVVDDEALLATFIKDFLECHGYSVVACNDGEQALKQLESNLDGFDLLITDQSMPGMTGVELIKKVTELKQDMPVVLCSGYDDVVDEGGMNKNNISFYLQKPVDNSQLLKHVEKLLA